MRYYRIEITDPKTNKPVDSMSTFTSLAGGTNPLTSGLNNPAALQIDFDIPVAPFSIPAGNAFLEITGVPIQQISQSANYNGKNITIYGGMSKGLPLANPAQQGILLQATIQQCFGNWKGTEMTLTFIMAAAPSTPDFPVNLVIQWRKGTSLSDAVAATLKAGFPGYTVQNLISPKLVLAYDDTGFFGTLPELASYLKDMSRDIGVGNSDQTYTGVEIVVQEKNFIVFDGTSPTRPETISFTDLMGQPTWIAPNQVQVTTVLRGDLFINDYITLPQSQVSVQQGSFSQYADKSIFQGTFMITQLHHVGSFRQPDGASWVTTFTCTPTPAKTS